MRPNRPHRQERTEAAVRQLLAVQIRPDGLEAEILAKARSRPRSLRPRALQLGARGEVVGMSQNQTTRNWTAGFSLCFHLPGLYFGVPLFGPHTLVDNRLRRDLSVLQPLLVELLELPTLSCLFVSIGQVSLSSNGFIW